MSKDTSLDDISEAITGLATLMDQRFDQVDARFEQVDARFEQIDARFENIEQRLFRIEGEQRSMREWLKSIDSRLMGVENDIAEIYDQITELASKHKDNMTKKDKQDLQKQMDALFVWAKEVSKQTGISLPKL